MSTPTAQSVGRRSFLAGAVAALGGVSGCGGARGGSDGRSADRSDPVSMLVAGSLNNALENGLRATVDERLRIEAHGSTRVARLVAEGQKDPDIVSVADVALFDGPLRPAWHAEFATNSLVVAYNSETAGGRRVAEAGREAWFRPIVSGTADLGRTDPDLDPLGYRTLFALELATEYYDTDRDLRAAVPTREQIYPETQLVSQFETGSIDAAITYRSMAVERGYEYVDLPAEIDLGDPARADAYARATYELPGGKVVRGGPITYGSTSRSDSEAVRDVFEAHVAGEYLPQYGFERPETYPRYRGDVPGALAN